MFFISCIVFFFVPKNYGIDMTGGLQISYSTPQEITTDTIEVIRESILQWYKYNEESIITDILIYTVNTNSIRVDVGLSDESDIKISQLQTDDIRKSIPVFFKKNSVEVSELSFVSVGNSFGKFVIDRAYLTLFMCFLSIAFYLMFTFRHSIEGASSFSFWAITLWTLLHDIIVSSGIFVLLGLVFPVLKIDTFFVTAILTILGYSINDTIVILDRIRSNYRDRGSQDKRNTKQIFEDSIQVSLRRSLYTSMTLAIVLLCMLFFGPDALIWFTTLMFLGVIVGTYSSICLAAPILFDINNSK